MLEELSQQYAALPKTPLRITVRLRSPLAAIREHPIHLDDILSRLVATEWGLEPTKKRDLPPVPLPLAQTDTNPPVWRASCAYVRPQVKVDKDFFVRRPHNPYARRVYNVIWPAGVFGDKTTPGMLIEEATGPWVDESTGGYRAFHDIFTIVATPGLIFHAVGNRQEVSRLLSNLRGVGKRRNSGFGNVATIEVEEIADDWSLFDPDGRPARYLPLSILNDPVPRSRIGVAPIRPPYWQEPRVFCVMPDQQFPVWRWDKKEVRTLSEEEKALLEWEAEESEGDDEWP